jgi:prefoldin alpha subunit
MQEINLTQVPLPQLSQLKNQLDQEVQFLSSSILQLKAVQQKFVSSKELLSKLAPENDGKETLVPLTPSLYVPGRLTRIDSVLLDIGTGYFAEKTIEEAQSYFQRKIEYLAKQIEDVQPSLLEKQKTREGTLTL